MKRALTVAAAVFVGLALVPFAPGTGRARADGDAAPPAAGPDGVISAGVESFALRVEYDIPLPAGSGSVAQVVGEARRSQAGENSKGVAAAPTAMDAVIGGKYIDPQSTGKPQRGLPQTECFYPGSLVDTKFFFPTSTQAETQSAPPLGYGTARCDAGPEVDLHSVAQSVGGTGTPTEALGPAVTSGAVQSDALAHPDKNVLLADTASQASAVSILGGVIKIGSVVARSHSQTTGKPGGATSTSEVAISDIDAGGQKFSLSSASVDGKEQLLVTVAGQTVALDSSEGKAVIDAVNAALKPQGCSLTPLTTPDTYPQGFLFARPSPEVGVHPDGTLAASYRGGLLAICDIPRNVSDPTTFTPQRAQILLGFAYTTTAATGEPLGFGLGDLGGGGGPLLGGVGNGAIGASTSGFATPAAATTGTIGSATDALAGTPSEPAAAPAAPPPQQVKPAALVTPFHMDPADRWIIGLLSLIAWGLLTHLGAKRFLFATDPCAVGAPEEAGLS